ncbi:molybdopterin-dependent oxidoreductase [Mycolicibacterium sp. CBM1]
MREGVIAVGVTALLMLTSTTACSAEQGDDQSTQSSAPSTATSAAPTTSNPYGVPSIDPPAPNEPVLTVTGGSAPLSLTMDALDALGSTTIAVDEPFLKKRQTFSGVPLSSLLAKAGIPNDATIDTVAINDYHYTSPVEPMIASAALIATKRDGAPIPYDQGGPIRLIYPDGTPLSSVLDAWNWSLASINVTQQGSGTS